MMMNFRVRLIKARKPNQPRLKFDIERLGDPDVACTFQGGKSHHSSFWRRVGWWRKRERFSDLVRERGEDMDTNTMIKTYNTAVPVRYLRRIRRKTPLVTRDVLDLCDGMRDLKKKWYVAEGVNEYMNMITIQFWTEVSPQKKSYKQLFVG